VSHKPHLEAENAASLDDLSFWHVGQFKAGPEGGDAIGKDFAGQLLRMARKINLPLLVGVTMMQRSHGDNARMAKRTAGAKLTTI
jgi:hypothetical protein